jgi:uncharacterized protein (TIGR02271 family)
MPLYKLKDFDPNYSESFGGEDVKKLDVYTQGNDKIGNVDEVLVDDEGRFRYLVVDTGAWFFGKKVLLPVGLARIDYTAGRVFVDGLRKDQVEKLPEYKESMTVDYDYEERVRGVYRPLASTKTTAAASPTPAPTNYTPDTYSYDREASLYNMNEQDHQTLKLYEERLVANKTRMKTGEVAVGKRVETQTAQVSVPVEKERVVIERTTPTDAGAVVTPGEAEASFQSGEVARIELYEETADIHKEAFVREEVRISKEVDHETVQAQETIRREELDIKTEDASGKQTKPQ